MKIIVAVDKNWGIGKDNKMMWSLPADMKFFREKTTGHVVVMGRKTLESFPNGLPLKNRVNIVMTRRRGHEVKGAVTVHTEAELRDALKSYEGEEIYVIGGAQVYRQLLPYCDTAYVTKIDRAFDADTYFPNLDELADWKQTEEGEEQTCFDLEYRFAKYERA